MTQVKKAGNLILLASSWLLSIAVVLSAFSVFLTGSNNSTALALNPFNSKARVNRFVELARQTPPQPDAVEALSLQGYRYAASDFRFLTLLGIAQELRGDAERAQQFFLQVERFMPTEFQAIVHRYYYLIAKRQLPEAAELANRIGIRWSNSWGTIAATMPLLVQSDDALRILTDGIGQTDQGRKLIITPLRAPATLPAAYRVIIYWSQRGLTGIDALVHAVTNSFVNQKEYQTAYFLFRQSLREERQQDAKYVFNGEFQYPPTGSPFDWQVTEQPGVTVERVKLGPAGGQAGGSAAAGFAMELRFRNAPVTLDNFKQTILLKAGRYRLSVRASSEDLVAPKPIGLAIQCYEGKRQITSVQLDNVRSGIDTVSSEFTVPGECEASLIRLTSQSVKSSWKDRYSGVLRLHGVAVEYLGES